MNKNRLRLIAASLIAIVANDAAVAANVISASSSMQNLSYRLVDLDPNDGVAPSITFGFTLVWGSSDIGTLLTEAKTSVRYGPIFDDTYLYNGSQTAMGDAFSRPDLSQVSVDGVARSDSSPQGMSASVDISTDVLTDPRAYDGLRLNFSASSAAIRTYDGNPSFSLSPKTKLIVEGVADSHIDFDASSLKGTALDAVLNQLGSLNVQRWGGATLSMAYFNDKGEWVSLDAGTPSQSAHVIDQSGVHEVNIALDYPSLEHEVFQAELVNDSDHTVTGSYGWINNTRIEITGSVPEPGTWALMGLGFAGIAMVRRRGSRPS